MGSMLLQQPFKATVGTRFLSATTSQAGLSGLTAVMKGIQVVWPAVGLNIISQQAFQFC